MATTAGLILAAGVGTRFGGGKLLARIDGRLMLQHVLDLAAVAGLDPVVVVLGHDAQLLIDRCDWRNETRLINGAPEEGISTSIRLGLAALERSVATRVVVLLGDQPLLSHDQLESVMRSSGRLTVPRYSGVPGNPVVLDRSIWPLAAALEGDRGFSQLFAARPDLVTYVDVPGTNADVDTRDELEASQSRRNTRPIRPYGGRGSQ